MSFRFKPSHFASTWNEIGDLLADHCNQILYEHVKTRGLEEIKPEKCEHKHKRMINYSLVAETCKWAECQDCGKHLVAKWEEAE